MFNLKKSAALLLSIIICFSFVACGVDSDRTSTSGFISDESFDSESVDKESISDGLKEPESADHEHIYTKVNTILATCEKEGVKSHYKCDICGKNFVYANGKLYEASDSALVVSKTKHKYTKEVTDIKFLVSEATYDSPRIYKKSCVCGRVPDGDNYETFVAGKALKDYENVDKSLYTPTSLTMTLYDAANCEYGFTWNTCDYPAMPIIRYSEGGTLADGAKEAGANIVKEESYAYVNGSDKKIVYYVCKVDIKLKPSTVYTYKAEDKYLGLETEAATIKTMDPTSEKFRFSHVSDSQSGDLPDGTGSYFSKTLRAIEQGGSNLIIHTGDVVEYSKYESFWKEMLDTNYKYLSKIPVMAISGNHETSYRNGNNETYKHFNYKIPQQSTDKGFYYSFSYGNVKFIMLNTNVLTGSSLSDDQYEWLRNELYKKTEKWTIVSLHNPMYSVGKWGADESRNGIALSLRKQLGDLFAEYKVDLVLQGHDHCVSRSYPIGLNGAVATEKTIDIDGVSYIDNPNGVLYVMNGPAGNQARNVFKNDEALYAYAMNSSACTWAEFDVDGDKLTITVKTIQFGIVKDIILWGISKTSL